MTVYFINEGLGTSNSGIEHAEFDRARLFRKNHIPFKLVTSVYIPKLHDILPMFALRDKESVNMFDYFQKATDISRNPIHPNDIDFGVDVEATKNGLIYNATFNGHFMGRITVNPNDEVERVEYFDVVGNLYLVSYYDSRGFLSLNQWYSPDNQIEVETWFDINGIPVIEKFHALNRIGKSTSTWKINNQLFNTIDDVRLYFYNQLNQSGKNMFLMDRANVSEWQLTHLDKPAYNVFMLHNHQSSDAQNPNAPLLNDNYEWTLANIDKWDAVVSATPQQTHDVQSRWGNQSKYFTVPVGVIPELQLNDAHISINQRKKHSMLVTARVATEKGIDKMIEALAIARQTIPDLTIDVYGYVDHGNQDLATKMINQAMHKLDDKNAVTIHPHSKDVHKLHEQYPVYLIFSKMEGFNLALMEAQSAGMVGLTNDVSYGPNELVKDGENGYIVDYNDVSAYAQKMIELFSNDSLLQKLSDGAYQLSHRYSEESVWKDWQKVFDDFDIWSQNN